MRHEPAPSAPNPFALRPLVTGTSVLLLAVAAGASGPQSARAARPIRGANYFGFDGRLSDFDSVPNPPGPFSPDTKDLTAALRVLRSGRRLSGRSSGSYVRFFFGCRRDKSGTVEGEIPLASRRLRGPAIRRDGSFRSVKRTGRLRYRLRGRFVSRDAARLIYRVSVPPSDPKNRSHPGRCVLHRRRVALRKGGQPAYRGCRSQPATTLASGSGGRVFEQYRWDSDGYFFAAAVFGCLFETNRRVTLSANDGFEQVSELRLAGAYVAYGLASCADAGCGYYLEEQELHDGRGVRKVGVGDSNPGLGGPVEDVELKDNGSVAWISSSAPDRTHAPLGVWAYDSAGQRLLDSGSISPKSLTLDGSTLHWVKDGIERSATLY